MEGIFDSHAHYDDAAFAADREELLASLPAKGVCGVVNAASDLKSAEASLTLAHRYPYFWAAVGVHPHEAEKAPGDYLERLTELLRDDRAVAVGEIGLDYHYDFSPRETQKKVFEEQLALAKELDCPVVVHDREAHADTLALLKRYRPKGVVHCFSGSVEMMREVVRLGMSIGLGGVVTFKNARKTLTAAAAVPADKLLIETDCPYMTPVPFRGKRCDSSMIRLTAEKIAAVRGMEVSKLLRAAWENAERLFGISR